MYGLSIDTLSVFTLQNGNRSKPLWRLTGNKGDVWLQANVTISTSMQFQVRYLFLHLMLNCLNVNCAFI